MVEPIFELEYSVGNQGGVAHVSAMARYVENLENTMGKLSSQILTNRKGGQIVLFVLQDQAWVAHMGQIGPVIGKKRRSGEDPGDHWVCGTKTIRQTTGD
jgi:hypothetical protein